MLQVGGQGSGYWIVVWRGLKSTPVVNSLLGLGALAPANCRRPHLDLVRSRRRDLRDDLDGFIQPLDLDEIKPGQPPRVPAKRAVGDGDPPLRTRTVAAVWTGWTASEASQWPVYAFPLRTLRWVPHQQSDRHQHGGEITTSEAATAAPTNNQ
jgi:hypothetical protein